MNYKEAESWLETYSLEDILELNNLTTEDILIILVEQELIQLPEVEPLHE